MPQTRNEVYHIRDLRPGDEAAIVALFGTVFGKPLTESEWWWKYTGTGTMPPPVQLAFDTTGKLIGHAGAIPLKGWRYGQPVPFFQICDVMVHPAARGQLGGRNLFTLLVRKLLGNLAERYPNVFAYGFPGRRPFRLGEYTRVYGEVEQALTIHRPVRQHMLPVLYTKPLAWSDARLDRLWARLAPRFTLALVRDQAYLHWRYAANPFRSYNLLGLHLAGHLLGWAVTRREDKQLRVIDLLIARRWLKLALMGLDRAATDFECVETDFWLPSGWREAASGRTEPTGVVVANMVWKLPVTTEEAHRALYYTMGDLDIF